jgi:hypothetical protein
MTRFLVSVNYKTAGGNPSHCALLIVAQDDDHAARIAFRRASIRGRRGLQLSITREA